ncbi:DUF4352 domain-containing protein [Bacillus suaedae]|uniref:DUF4352 domain-containing protein n=1 Tax=Halalkalibacter suaedae TaxID=2822140 RepID=A0A941AQM3_9BACI|nr:DUF4352 domain-containing protein [Bacillus suaedae]
MKTKIILFTLLCLCLLALISYMFLSNADPGVSGSLGKSSDQMREINGIEMLINDFYVEPYSESEQFIIVDLSIQNTTEKVYEFSPFKFTLVDEEGFAFERDTSIETKGVLGGQIHPERMVRGELAFLVPVGTNYELVYTEHLRTGQLIWKLTVDKD